jgi:hypothetical protein
VGAGIPVTSYDLGILVDQAAKPISAEDPDVSSPCGRMSTPGRRTVVQRPVGAVRVIGILAQDQPQVPLAGDQQPVLASGATQVGQQVSAAAHDPGRCRWGVSQRQR